LEERFSLYLFHELKDERNQIEQIEVIFKSELDELRKFHRVCMERHRKGEWKVKGSIFETASTKD